MSNDRHTQPPVYVSTYTLVAVLVTILAWELELVELAFLVMGRPQLNGLTHGAWTALCGVLSIAAMLGCKREFVRVRHCVRRIAVTPFQAVLVIGMMISIGGVSAIVIQSLLG